jgi:hypothetical protein
MPKTKAKKLLGRAVGQVGIFWVFRGKVLAATWALQDGEQYGEAITGLIDHVDFWPQLQQQHPELRGLEYETVPRGRVVFKIRAEKFVIYLDKVLLKPKIKQSVLTAFELRDAHFEFMSDPHYVTDTEELDRIFTDL